MFFIVLLATFVAGGDGTNCTIPISNNVTEVDCRYRGLASIPRFPPSVERAFLDGNIIKVLDSNIEKSKHLIILTLMRNQITTLMPGAFKGYESLYQMNLGYNRITTIYNGAFNGLKSLKILYLHRNKLTFVRYGTFRGFPSLSVLDIRFNGITSIQDASFDGLKNLSQLDIGTNNIRMIESFAFYDQKGIRRINLFGNSLTCKCGLVKVVQSLPLLTTVSGYCTETVGGGTQDLLSLRNSSQCAITTVQPTTVPRKTSTNTGTEQKTSTTVLTANTTSIPRTPTTSFATYTSTATFLPPRTGQGHENYSASGHGSSFRLFPGGGRRVLSKHL